MHCKYFIFFAMKCLVCFISMYAYHWCLLLAGVWDSCLSDKFGCLNHQFVAIATFFIVFSYFMCMLVFCLCHSHFCVFLCDFLFLLFFCLLSFMGWLFEVAYELMVSKKLFFFAARKSFLNFNFLHTGTAHCSRNKFDKYFYRNFLENILENIFSQLQI